MTLIPFHVPLLFECRRISSEQVCINLTITSSGKSSQCINHDEKKLIFVFIYSKPVKSGGHRLAFCNFISTNTVHYTLCVHMYIKK